MLCFRTVVTSWEKRVDMIGYASVVVLISAITQALLVCIKSRMESSNWQKFRHPSFESYLDHHLCLVR